MTLRLVTARGPSLRRRKRARQGRMRRELETMRRMLRRCPACGANRRDAAPCDAETFSAEARAEHDAIVAEGSEHVHMKCPDCGHEAFITFEDP